MAGFVPPDPTTAFPSNPVLPRHKTHCAGFWTCKQSGGTPMTGSNSYSRDPPPTSAPRKAEGTLSEGGNRASAPDTSLFSARRREFFFFVNFTPRLPLTDQGINLRPSTKIDFPARGSWEKKPARRKHSEFWGHKPAGPEKEGFTFRFSPEPTAKCRNLPQPKNGC